MSKPDEHIELGCLSNHVALDGGKPYDDDMRDMQRLGKQPQLNVRSTRSQRSSQ